MTVILLGGISLPCPPHSLDGGWILKYCQCATRDSESCSAVSEAVLVGI